MVESAPINGHELGLAEFLRQRARSARESRLTLDIVIGLVAVIVAAALRPDWWQPLASAGLSFLAFGTWASLGRVVLPTESAIRAAPALRIARAVAAAVGIVSASALLFFLWAATIGTWIS